MMEEEPTAASLSSQALNTAKNMLLRTSELTALNVLSGAPVGSVRPRPRAHMHGHGADTMLSTSAAHSKQAGQELQLAGHAVRCRTHLCTANELVNRPLPWPVRLRDPLLLVRTHPSPQMDLGWEQKMEHVP